MQGRDTISTLPGLVIGNEVFEWRGQRYSHKDITSIGFTATVTSNSINGIPTGKTYSANFSLKLVTGGIISIKGANRALRSGISRESFEGLQKSYAVMSNITLAQRLDPMERESRAKGFFSFLDYQFTQAGEIFRRGRLVADLGDQDICLLKEPFSIKIQRKRKGLADKVFGRFSDPDVDIPLEWDQDCFLYMLHDVAGYSWKGSPPPKKPIDRRALFYSTVLRFGASLAMADGAADASELTQLKKFFDISSDSVAEAARIFNEELRSPSSVESILAEFSREFADAVELRETFLLGMCTVALADGELDDTEISKLRLAASILRLGEGSLARAFLASGFDFEAYMSSANSDRGTRAPRSKREVELRVLNLEVDATHDQIRAAYREMVKRYHPDRLRGQGLPESEIVRSEAILKQVTAAYEYLAR